MDTSTQTQLTAVTRFRELHETGCFLLPNPFDVGTAIYLHHLGFEALATSSAGFAFTRGQPDGSVSLETMLTHIGEVVLASPLPVNADFQNGYAHEPERVAANVSRCIATGVAGLSIEDNTGDRLIPLYDEMLAVERIKAARQAIDETNIPVVLTARCEAWLVNQPDALSLAIERLTAFAEAGADCLYAPGVRDSDQISTIVKAVAPKPVNVLVSRPAPNLTLARLRDIGVRRISVGSALSLVAWGAFIRAARSIVTTGEFDLLTDGPSFAEMNEVFGSRG